MRCTDSGKRSDSAPRFLYDRASRQFQISSVGKPPNMNSFLQHQTALVTGSTANIGFVIARRLCEAGARVILHGPTREDVAEAKTRLQTHCADARVETVAFDLADPTEIDQTFDELEASGYM